MEGMRGFAVALVFFVHYSTGMEKIFGAKFDYINFIHAIGNTGVDIFFVLSGFLIYRAVIRRPINYYKYAWRRVERIYPTFMCVFAIYIVLCVVFPERSKIPEAHAVQYLVMNFLLLPGIFDIDPLITVAWSLSYEVFYYITVPVLVIVCSLRSFDPKKRIVLFLSILASYTLIETIGNAPHFRLTMFIGGILLYEISCLKSGARNNALFDGISLGLLVLALAVFGFAGGPFAYIGLNAALVLVLYRCLYAPGLAARIFAFRPMRWLGNMSYSYYLMHSLGLHGFFFILSFFPVYPAAWVYALLIPAAFVATVVASVVVYILIERPLSLRPANAVATATA